MTKIIELDEIDSTNKYAKKIAEEGADSFTLVWAHRQTKGVGSHNRTWKSLEGNLFWSLILRPDNNWPRHSDIVYVNALAVFMTIKKYITNNSSLTIKWPNDILLNEKKIAGTLLESSTHRHNKQPAWIVIGTGINLMNSPDPDPSMIYPPTSLKENGFDARKEIVSQELLEQFKIELNNWLIKGFDDLRVRYLEKAFRLNQEISIGNTIDKKKYTRGKYLGIDNQGSLELMLEDGSIKVFHSGDVFY